jgi:hypothetical protein
MPTIATNLVLLLACIITAVNLGAADPITGAILIDCSRGNFKRRACEAIRGPNGGAGACKFKTNRIKDTYLRCINNRSFVDFKPETSITTIETDTTAITTVASSTTTTKNPCPDGVGGYERKLFSRQLNNDARIDRVDNVRGANRCALLCSSMADCLFFTFKESGRVCDRFSEIPPQTRNAKVNAYERLANCVADTTVTATSTTSAAALTTTAAIRTATTTTTVANPPCLVGAKSILPGKPTTSFGF